MGRDGVSSLCLPEAGNGVWLGLTPPSLPPTPLSGLHSRRVLDTVVSEPSPGLPWYSRVVYVDDQVIYVYTSGMQKAEPRTAWMAQNEGPEFWDERTWWAQRHQKWFKASLNTLGQLYNQSPKNPEFALNVMRILGIILELIFICPLV
uniref:MHC class I-like antigen recognition-like domain-containing protein n=1 Tax=Terrapene triunguis TaxID=2587831 RepID=A0A674JPN9_9SAUR